MLSSFRIRRGTGRLPVWAVVVGLIPTYLAISAVVPGDLGDATATVLTGGVAAYVLTQRLDEISSRRQAQLVAAVFAVAAAGTLLNLVVDRLAAVLLVLAGAVSLAYLLIDRGGSNEITDRSARVDGPHAGSR